MKENLNKNNLFSKKIDQKGYPSHQLLGLYDSSYEHDACGVGMLVNINGDKSHELVDAALTVLENMKHRGAEGADNKTGDGAGIMIQIPHEFILLQGIPVPEKGKYGTGLVFLPKDEKRQATIMGIVIEEVEREGLQLMHMRNVPSLMPGWMIGRMSLTLPNAGVDSTLSLASIQARLPRMVLISPLCASRRNGCAKLQVGNVLVLKRECTNASPLVKYGCVRSLKYSRTWVDESIPL